jgi:hypothetical protein
MTAVVLTPQVSLRQPVESFSYPSLARRVTATTTSQNVALTSGIRAITIHVRDAACRVAIGSGPQTANATSSVFLPQGSTTTFQTPLNGAANLAVIRDTAAAVNSVLEITELRS